MGGVTAALPSSDGSMSIGAELAGRPRCAGMAAASGASPSATMRRRGSPLATHLMRKDSLPGPLNRAPKPLASSSQRIGHPSPSVPRAAFRHARSVAGYRAATAAGTKTRIQTGGKARHGGTQQSVST